MNPNYKGVERTYPFRGIEVGNYEVTLEKFLEETQKAGFNSRYAILGCINISYKKGNLSELVELIPKNAQNMYDAYKKNISSARIKLSNLSDIKTCTDPKNKDAFEGLKTLLRYENMSRFKPKDFLKLMSEYYQAMGKQEKLEFNSLLGYVYYGVDLQYEKQLAGYIHQILEEILNKFEASIEEGECFEDSTDLKNCFCGALQLILSYYICGSIDTYYVNYLSETNSTVKEALENSKKLPTKRRSADRLRETDAEEKPQDTLKKAVYKLESSKNNDISEVFIGRDTFIEDIHNAFKTRSIVFLHGIGGIGKTEIARHYWRDYNNDYNTVVYAHYDNSLSTLVANDEVFNLTGFFRKITAQNIDLNDTDYAREKLNAIRSSVNERERTLVILDNFNVSVIEEPFWEEFREFIDEAHFHLLVTTRIRPDIKRYYTIPIPEMKDADLKELFCIYAGEESGITPDNPLIDELLKLTYKHTYALELAAKRIAKGDFDIADLIKHLETRGNDIKLDAYMTISQLFHLTEFKDEEKYYLRCLALMPQSGVRRNIFVERIGDAQEAWESLAQLGIIKAKDTTISLHPLIREIVIRDLKPTYAKCEEFLLRISGVREEFSNVWDLPSDKKRALLDCYKSITSIITDITEENYLMYCRFMWAYNFVGTYEETFALSDRILKFAEQHFSSVPEEIFRIIASP